MRYFIKDLMVQCWNYEQRCQAMNTMSKRAGLKKLKCVQNSVTRGEYLWRRVTGDNPSKINKLMGLSKGNFYSCFS